ncbi:MAG: hypothetical protein JWO31_69 [Phycisphaerales bacterium]|nr:hypothetical protein [Phycisphaerales bacterium]
MSLPFRPEPIEALVARLPAALREVVRAEFCRRFPAEAPSKKRAHVFDLIDRGQPYRIVVSLDHERQLGRFLHVSISRPDGPPSPVAAQRLLHGLLGPCVLYLRDETVRGSVRHFSFKPPAALRGHPLPE